MRLRRLLVALLLALPLLGAKGRPAPTTAVEDELDRTALAARLIADGFWDRAATVLAEVDPDTEDGLDRGRFFTLRGLVRSHEGLHDQAAGDFRLALAEPDADPLVHLQLAQSLLATGDAQGALQALDDAGEVGANLTGTWHMRARAHLALDDVAGAWVALVRGEDRFPGELEFARQRVFLLVRQGLFQAAVTEGRQLLARIPDDPTAWLVIGESLRQAGERREALLLLEEARLRFPSEPDVAAQLARLYLDDGHPAAAGEILQVAAEVKPALFAAAAESFRQAGELHRALYLNGRVPDAVDKARQRLGLYIELGDWARAAALEDRLDRLGLLQQDALRYALAFAWFRLGDLERAEGWLVGIADARVFQDATALRQAMQECRDAGGCP
ncbi:MAG: hypothetical protein H6732_02810 [Alphaproteobacteria bacterium]|nr:hypothetical protein [Alphaproteobacteria bacterium]